MFDEGRIGLIRKHKEEVEIEALVKLMEQVMGNKTSRE
jgi:hypothetical protein